MPSDRNSPQKKITPEQAKWLLEHDNTHNRDIVNAGEQKARGLKEERERTEDLDAPDQVQ